MKFYKAHAKALTALATAEIAAAITVLSASSMTWREIALAFIMPLGVGGLTHQVTNNPGA